MPSPPDPGLAALLDHLSLEARGADLFRGRSEPSPSRRVFGGLVFAQAMRAAQATVEERLPHSAHAYFLRPGDPRKPIDYEVDRIRDGRSFTTRRVVARQDAEAIFNLSISFHIEEPGPHRQIDGNLPPEPSGERYEVGLARGIKALGFDVPTEKIGFRGLEILVDGGLDMVEAPAREPELRCWLRTRGEMPDDLSLHAAVLAYASDLTIMIAAYHPLDFGAMSPGVQSASLDHAIWLHEPFRVDDWIYIAQDSPVHSRSRGLGRALYYTRDGRLVASATQEGLIRKRER
jgi:acyl-CoA thioesterase-2